MNQKLPIACSHLQSGVFIKQSYKADDKSGMTDKSHTAFGDFVFENKKLLTDGD